MYCDRNFKTKKAMKEAFKAGDQITVYQPGGMFPSQKDGSICIEGPHFPEPHKWYANVEIKNRIIIKIKS